MNEIRLLPAIFPGCARVFNAIERWPTLLTNNVRRFKASLFYFLKEGLPLCGDVSCEFLVIEVGDESSTDQLFFSGEVHGDERVGPHAVLESVRNLCTNSTGIVFSDRLVVSMPLANPLGYYTGVREENNVDPNRDFPYDHGDSACLESLTARVIRHIFYHYTNIKSGITFHGGEQSITYPWGSYSHAGQHAPDDKTLKAIATELQRVSGGGVYEVGTMSDVVYPVHGGFEDWAYMLGFDAENQCASQSFSDSVKLPSASIFLVEATKEKTPPEAELGSSNELWITDDSMYISPVPRCVRMILKTIELVKPTATFVPIRLKSSLVVILRGCISAVITTRLDCDGCTNPTEISNTYLCSNPIQFIKIPAGGPLVASSSIVFDPELASPGGYLDYAKNRTGYIAGSYRPGLCGLVDQGLYICVSSDTIAMHPFLIHHKPTISLMDQDGTVLFTISGLSQLITETAIDLPEDFEDISLQFVSSAEPGFVRNVLMSSQDPGTDNAPDNNLLWLLFLLLIPIGLLTLFFIRRACKRREQVYLAVDPASP